MKLSLNNLYYLCWYFDASPSKVLQILSESNIGNMDFNLKIFCQKEEWNPYPLEEYTNIIKLVSGAFGNVYKAKRKSDGETIAIKEIIKSTITKESRPKLEAEIRISRSLHGNPNVATTYSFNEDAENVYLFMEYITGDTLDKYFKTSTLTSDQSLNIMLQLANALKFIHDKGIAHNDLKPLNLMYDNNKNIKLIDFGLACYVSAYKDQCTNDRIGSDGWMAPEIFDKNPIDRRAADIWAFGYILFALLFGKYTFDDKINIILPQNAKAYNIKEFKNIFDFVNGLPDAPEYKLLKGMITTEDKRLKIDEIVLLLQNLTPDDLKWRPIAPTAPNDATFLKREIIADPKNQGNKLFIEMLMGRSPIPNSPSYTSQAAPYTYILSSMDVSKKYGVGYRLSDGTTGVYFNDSTKMAKLVNNDFIDYYYNEKKNYIYTQYTFNDAMIALTKKTQLLTWFDNAIKDSYNEEMPTTQPPPPVEPNIYVYQWLSAKQSICFFLSNKVFQANFFDNVTIVIKLDSEWIIRFTPTQFKVFNINSDEIPLEDETKIKYIQDLLSQL